jgi:hypothetical protein
MEHRMSAADLVRDRFIIDGAAAVKAGALRALMSNSREPLRVFRDQSAAKLALKKGKPSAEANTPAPAAHGSKTEAAAAAPATVGGTSKSFAAGGSSIGEKNIDFNAISAVARCAVFMLSV